MNQLQLYMEHTFAYADHETVWRDASPYTSEDIRRIDACCRERFIELVPNQNSFGHMHRWLKHPAYRHLAETEGSFVTSWGETRSGPFSLNPTGKNSLQFLAGLYDELLPCFTSNQTNVGCDETFDLGSGKSKAACDERGKGRVYLDFLLRIRELLKQRGHSMQFWGDIVFASSGSRAGSAVRCHAARVGLRGRPSICGTMRGICG